MKLLAKRFGLASVAALLTMAALAQQPPPHAAMERVQAPRVLTKQEQAALARQLPVKTLTITPLAGQTNQAKLDVEVAPASKTAPALLRALGESKAVLNPVAGHPGRFQGVVTFDVAQFEKEQAVREALAAKGAKAPIFRGRQLIGFAPAEFISVSAIQRAIQNHLPLNIPPGVLNGLTTVVDPYRELMITDLNVAEDPTRTYDVCGQGGPHGNPNGAWTFATLMQDMANQSQTGVDPADFVESWLSTWLTTQQINGLSVPARTKMSQILAAWPRVNGKLDLTKAPLRLLAIVNRIDLRSGGAYGGGNAGEGRFVFGLLDGCNVSFFTVILEYGVPVSGCQAVENYANQWHALGSIAINDPSYNVKLQAITDIFTKANAAPSKPNGSALNQLRTDEIDLDAPWELREFHVETDHNLHEVAVKQTPDTNTINGTATLTQYANAKQAAILAGTYVIPATVPGSSPGQTVPFQGGSSLNFKQPWSAPGITSNVARHDLSLGTCNACHSRETDTPFMHVSARADHQQAALSPFLAGASLSPTNPDTFTMTDPIDGVTMLTYGDLLRREADLSLLLGAKCFAGGVLRQATFVPLDMVH
jgi:hypothetical protein